MDWDPDYDVYYDALVRENDPFGPYEEGYTGRPIPESSTRVGVMHHPDCPCKDSDPDWNCCNHLWEADYQNREEAAAEELHQEYWQ